VARSNVELATRALSDETDRVNAGVDDNLPLVTAQATLASAQSNLVESLYQYNVSKLALARPAGVLEQQYRVYLGQYREQRWAQGRGRRMARAPEIGPWRSLRRRRQFRRKPVRSGFRGGWSGPSYS
jgi:hypothetical protein